MRSLLSELGDEIADIERRLASLRASTRSAPVVSPASPREAPVTKTRKRTSRGTKGHVRGIAGTLAVLLRSIPAAEHAAIAAIRTDKGINAAIKAAQAAMKKR